MKCFRYFFICFLFFIAGCSTSRGKMALLDIDFREADQIEASQYESIYNTNNIEQIETKTFPTPELFGFLKLAKFRIRIFSIEWAK